MFIKGYQAPELDVTVYRIEFPRLNRDDTIMHYHRIVSFLNYWHNKEGVIAIIAYSEHTSWPIYEYVNGKKGGHKKKVFDESEHNRAPPHLHIYISGKGSRRIVEKLYNNTLTYFIKHGQPEMSGLLNTFIQTDKVIPLEYVIDQASSYRVFGDIENYIQVHKAQVGNRKLF